MAADPHGEKLIAQYLLGELPEEQQVEIEDRAFADQEFLANITAVENDLIDEYVRDEMPKTERRRFESHFLASESRRKRVEFAKALAQLTAEIRVTERETRKAGAASISWRDALAAFIHGLNPAGKIALAAAMLLLLIGGAWLITQTLTLRSQLSQLQAQQNDRQTLQQQVEHERRRNEELSAQLNQEKDQRAQTDESLRRLSETLNRPPSEAPRSIIASLTLLPGVSRSATTQPKLVLPSNANVVQLQIGIDPEETFKTFGVELRTAAGRLVWTRERLTAGSSRKGRSIRLTLPATALLPGEYELRLKGIPETGSAEDVGFYYFQVMKR